MSALRDHEAELLRHICETPGWQPATPDNGDKLTTLRGLEHRGWIRPRGEGWEATSQAIDLFPDFEERSPAPPAIDVLEYVIAWAEHERALCDAASAHGEMVIHEMSARRALLQAGSFIGVVLPDRAGGYESWRLTLAPNGYSLMVLPA